MPFRPRMACCVHFSLWLYCRGQHFLGPESSDIFWVTSWWPWRSSAFPVQDQQPSYFLGKFSITITWLMCFTTIDGIPIFNQFFLNHLVVKKHWYITFFWMFTTSHQDFSHGWCFFHHLQESDRHKDEDVKERQAWRRWAATDSVGRGGDAGPGRRRRSNIDK